MKLARLVEASATVAKTRSRNAKIAALAEVLRALSGDEARIGVAYAAGELPQGRIGIGWAAVRDMIEQAGAPAAEPTLELLEVSAVLDAIQGASGSGSAGRRRELLGGLVARATEAERSFLGRLLVGELRQGALEGLVLEAIATATGLAASEVRRAAMLGGSVSEVGAHLLREGAPALASYRLVPFRPVLPMLASPADDVDACLERLGEASFELKLDGARVQVHKDGDDVRVYTRSLHDATDRVPDIVEAVRALPARSLVLDGEAIVLAPDGSPVPFQTTMRRFGRRLEVERMRAELPLSTCLFDVLLVDDRVLLDEPARERFACLESLVPRAMRVPRIVTASIDEAEAYFADAVGRGHEGLMAKSLTAPYEAGHRGFSWMKLKPAHTLDLVVLAVERGSGRREGTLSNLHLGARDPEHGGFVMLGKTFKGMTDAMLAWQTEHLRGLAIGESDGYVVHVRPELVAEIAFNDVQASPRYPGGLALRFARVKRYRPDKRAEEADTIDAVRAIFSKSDRPAE